MAITVASKASSPIYVCPYHVFLSTKSADSCENFIDKLYTALLQSGIHTFRNYDKHERGEGFSLEIRKAVKQSKVSIIIFSENYALSKWCLDELVNLVERKEKESHVILPVFYDVDPSHIRKQKGSYENAFLEYERKEGITRVQRWRAALKDVANLAGIVLKNGREFELIQDIVERTWIKLSRTVFKVAPYLVGIYSRVKNISSWLQDGLNNNPISVIHGTGGIGKTTIAKILYHLHHARFEISSFIPNIKEFTNRRNGLLYLQKHILSDILKEENVDVNDVQQGFLKIKKALYCKTFLLVLDDVDKLDQLNVVLDLRDWFSTGSKIMITTRDEKLLNSQNNCFSYPAKELDFDEAIQLFSFHAFQRDNSTNGFMDLSKELVNHCQGLPLALQVLGSSLLNATKDMWEITLRKLSEISDSQIIKVLEVGYDNLHDDLEKNFFLDVACFFVGKDKDYVVTVLDECDLYARAGIEKLIDKCFLKLNQLRKLEMHELIREMCRKVIHQESHGELGKYSRLWDSGNALNVLGEKMGTELVECLNLDLLEVQNHDYLMQSLKGNPIRRHRCSFFSCLPLTSSSASVTMSSTEGLNADVFSRLPDLRLLHLNNVQLFGSYERFPKKLKWLCWHNFKSRSLPCDFPMEHLSVLEMHNSNLERVWEGTQILRSLKVLDLSHSHCLTRTPDFSYFPCLKRLVLEDCVNLAKIHESIGQLYGLVLLNLSGCENLRKLPKEIQRLKSLRALYLSGCLNLDFSESSSMLEFLPRSLESLDLSHCNLTDKAIPSDLSILPFLKYLILGKNPISTIPKSIKSLDSLQVIEIFDCTHLQLLPKLPSNLKRLNARNCRSLKKITNLPNYLKSLKLQLKNCEELVEVQEVFKLKPIAITDKFLNLWGEIDFKHFSRMEMEFVNNLTSTRRISPIQGLYEFGIFSIFIPASSVPEYFTNKSVGCASISISVPQILECKRHVLDISVVFAHNNECEKHCIVIRNETKGITWIYSPVVFAYSGPSSDHENVMWLSRWGFGEELDSGDLVSVLVDMSCCVKEFGINHFSDEIVEEEEALRLEGYSSSRGVIGRDLSEYQLNTGVYLLTHHP